MIIELIDTTNVMLNEIKQGCTQKQLASTYGLALLSSDPTDWRAVNEAIIERWSASGLERVKTLAWKYAEQGGPDAR
jgi:hypothetical protein